MWWWQRERLMKKQGQLDQFFSFTLDPPEAIGVCGKLVWMAQLTPETVLRLPSWRLTLAPKNFEIGDKFSYRTDTPPTTIPWEIDISVKAGATYIFVRLPTENHAGPGNVEEKPWNKPSTHRDQAELN